MRRVILTLALLIISFVPLSGVPQPVQRVAAHSLVVAAPLHVSTLEIDLWPEFDKPSMLVIFTITLAKDVTLPSDVSIRIPARVGEPTAVATGANEDELFNTTYKRQTDGDWALVQLSAREPVVRIEYYDPSITVKGADKHFEYTWMNDYSVDSMSLRIQQPLTAQSMQFVPAFEKGAWSTNGSFQVYLAEVVPPAQGKSLSFAINYQKAGDDLSIASLPTEPPSSAPTAALPNQPPADNNLVLGIIIGIAAIVVLALLLVLWTSMQNGRKSTPSAKRTASTASADDDVLFCHKCGKKADPGDEFCRSCGAPLHRE